MIVAIPASDQSIDTQMDLRFGRAKYFLIYDLTNDQFEFVTNEQNMMARQGAGVQSAQTVANKNVQAVVASNVGPKAFGVLSSAKISIFTSKQRSLKEIIEDLKSEKLIKMTNANVEGHW